MTIFKLNSRYLISLFTFTTILSNAVYLFVAWILQQFFNIAQSEDFSAFWEIATIGVAIVLVLTVVTIFNERLKAGIIRDSNIELKKKITEDIVNSENPGEVTANLSLITNDMKFFEEHRIRMEINIINFTIQFIMSFIMSVMIDWVTTIAFIICAMVPVVMSIFTQNMMNDAGEKYSLSNSNLTDVMKDIFSGSISIRIYEVQKKMISDAVNTILGVEKAEFRVNWLTGLLTGLMTGVTLIFTFIVPFAVGIYRVMTSVLMLGGFMAIVQLSNTIVDPLMGILDAVNNFNTTKSIKEKVFGRNKKTNELSNPEKAVVNIENSFGFSSVSLGYDGVPIIDNLDLKFAVGKKYLLMAPSGYGKSTILLTLAGLLPPINGSYKIDGNDVDELDYITSNFGFIQQTPFIFNRSLSENITLGNSFSNSEILKAIEISGLSDLVNKKGLEYILGYEGNNLSGGQKQRVEIARAILFNREILLADEITSALDEETAKSIHNKLFSLPQTLIEVAHHVSEEDKMKYDEVIYLDKLVTSSSR